MSPSGTQLRIALTTFVVTGLMVLAVGLAVRNTARVQTLGQENRGLALSALNLSKQVAEQAHEIQEQRHGSLLDECRGDNQKYRNAIHRLRVIERAEMKSSPDAVVRLFRGAGIPIKYPKPIRRVEHQSIKGNFKQTVLLIGAIAPHHEDCQSWVASKAPRP